jgi:YesN/AraC family two-component response regulator
MPNHSTVSTPSNYNPHQAGYIMKKILVIEADECMRNLFTVCLETEGYHPIAAKNGFMGIQQTQRHLPDLVICSTRMLGMDGHDVLAEVRQAPETASIPFIFITGNIVGPELLQYIDVERDSYLIKPLTVDTLLQAISTQLEQAPVAEPTVSKSCLEPQANLADSESIFPSIPQLQAIFDFIEANYHMPITLSDVAQVAGYSPAYLTTLVGSQTGRTVARWIIERRMAEARRLLEKSDWSVEQIARTVGYVNARHFYRQFLQYHGVPPQVWRKEHQLLVAN